MKYFVIIPAAGIGVRMHADRPKQYLKIHDETLLERVVNLFSSIELIEKVIVVLHPQDVWWSTLKLVCPEKVLTAIGGKERAHSVLLGLDFLKDFASPDDFVLVHDAARPAISKKNILNFIAEMNHHPIGGLLALPVVDTLKKVTQDECVECTLPRESLWRAQTPQCFRYALLKQALEKALLQHNVVSDESAAVELLGHHPKIILGDARNIKVTFPEDLMLASFIVDRQ